MTVRPLALLLPVIAAGCMTTAPAAGDRLAMADIRNGAGAQVGSATLMRDNAGLRLNVTTTGVSAGTHGIHLHAVGRCDAPDFTSAGSHMNPTGREHGLRNPQGSHAGDLPNLVIDANGRGTLSWPWAARAADVMDADGTAIVIHATADDQLTDPSGNSGGRIACGVLVPA